jgi:hypothetical protein
VSECSGQRFSPVEHVAAVDDGPPVAVHDGPDQVRLARFAALGKVPEKSASVALENTTMYNSESTKIKKYNFEKGKY